MEYVVYILISLFLVWIIMSFRRAPEDMGKTFLMGVPLQKIEFEEALRKYREAVEKYKAQEQEEKAKALFWTKVAAITYFLFAVCYAVLGFFSNWIWVICSPAWLFLAITIFREYNRKKLTE